jgi:MinD-like ATPase involved in chromosome partitioning or flagellar assembly
MQMIPASQKKGFLEEMVLVVGNQHRINEDICRHMEKPFVGEVCRHENIEFEYNRERYHLVIIDNDSGDGIEAIKSIRKKSRKVPILYMSFIPEHEWIQKKIASKKKVVICKTNDVASSKVNALIEKYAEKPKKYRKAR